MDKVKEAEEVISKFTEKMKNLEDKLFSLLKANGVTEDMIEEAGKNPEANPFAAARDRLTDLLGNLPDITPQEDQQEHPSAGGDEEE